MCHVHTEFFGCWAGEEGYVAVEYVVIVVVFVGPF